MNPCPLALGAGFFPSSSQKREHRRNRGHGRGGWGQTRRGLATLDLIQIQRGLKSAILLRLLVIVKARRNIQIGSAKSGRVLDIYVDQANASDTAARAMIVCGSLFGNNLNSQSNSSLNMWPKPTGLLAPAGDRTPIGNQEPVTAADEGRRWEDRMEDSRRGQTRRREVELHRERISLSCYCSFLRF